MNIHRLLAGTLALILVAGLGAPAFAEAPADNVSNQVVPQVSAPQGATTINFDTFSPGDIPVGNEFAAQGILFSTPDLNLVIGSTVGSSPSSLGADQTNPLDFNGNVVLEFTDNNCVLDLEFLIFNPPFSATAFDIDGNPLATLNSAVPFSEIFSFGGMLVHKVQTSGTFYAIDDVTYTLESCGLVGGELLPIDSTVLVLAGLQTSAIWMLPVLAGVAGSAFGVLYIKSRRN